MTKKPLKTIFVIMPFVQVNGGLRDESRLTAIFLNHIKRPIEAANHLEYQYSVTRSGEAFSITRDIIGSLCRADIVIADLSGKEPNPNVMYELGVRLAISKDPLILIREDISGARNPFDVTTFFIKRYDPLDYSKLEEHLLRKLARLESGEEVFDNEVLRVIREELTLITPDPTSISPDRQRELVLRGIRTVADTTRTAYGPLGLSMQIRNKASSPSFAITGTDIVQGLRSRNLFEQEGIQLLGRAARSVFEKYGDGSKQVILMAAAMIEAAADGAGVQPGASVADELTSVAEAIIEQIQKSAGSVENWAGLAATAAKMEKVPLELYAMIELATQGGFITIEESSEPGIRVLRQDHYILDGGAVDEHFLSDENHTVTILDDPLVLVSPCSISSLREILPTLEIAARTNKPLLLVADKVEDEVLATLRINFSRGSLKCVPVRAPGFGYRKAETLHDLAAVTGATVLDPETGLSIENAKLSVFGGAQRIVINARSTEVQGGAGADQLIKQRVANIRSKLSTCDSDYEREQLLRRLARLSRSSATVFVGAPTRESLQLLKRQVQEALSACSLAAQSGAVVAAASLVAQLASATSSGDANTPKRAANRILAAGLEAPLRSLIRRVGGDENYVLQAVHDGKVFDARSGNLVATGATPLRDAVAVVAAVVSIAASTTSTFLRTGSWRPSPRPDDEDDGNVV